MGPRIQGGHDDMGTGPERARPRLLRIGDSRRGSGARRQRETKGASKRREPAAACANEGEQIVEVLNQKGKGNHESKRRLDWNNGVWEASWRPACKVGLTASRRFC